MNAPHSFFKKPLFWALATALSIASIAFTYKYFTKAMPIISLSITMDRKAALEKAHALSLKNNWLPADAHTAVMFESDTFLQFFVELECGGKEQFTHMMHTHLFEPYTWHVRHFKEKTTEETHIIFTPTGIPYGFEQKLAETTTLPNLSVDQARTIALDTAATDWGIDFTPYKEIEASKDEKPCGRVDHTFVYQRTDAQLGAEGFYRLSLKVSGNIVTKVEHFVFIPETFNRRYEEMRSGNTVIATAGSVSMMVLYIFFGLIIAGIFFLRKHYLVFKTPMLLASFIGILVFFSQLNHYPFLWMSYDTATSATSFLINSGIRFFIMAVMTSVFFTLIFTIATTWDRLAFPRRLIFWKLWTPQTGSSLTVLGQTIGGYVYACIFFGIATATYLFLTSLPGWWAPANTVTDPNILATYFPWLDACANALQAGVWEEMMFRAIPLASAAYIGRRFNKERLFIGIAFIIQACIFAAAHANYAQQPAYFRFVELILPSCNFGLLYLYFGLLPGIIAHFFYDLILMALPIFASDTSYAYISKIAVILFGCIPLFIVIYKRYQQGSWTEPSLDDYNTTEQTLLEHTLSDAVATDAPETGVSQEAATISGITKNGILICGIIGLLLYVTCNQFSSDAPPIIISKSQAIETAQERFDQITENQENAGLTWQPYPFIALATTPALQEEERFVWQTQGKDTYKKLLGAYITPPSWVVRYLSFDGDIVARAQEYIFLLDNNNQVLRQKITLPESMPGASLSQGQARGIALETVEKQFRVTTEHIKEISAVAKECPARKDWTFIFQDTRYKLQDDGQARITVTLAGDQVTGARPNIFVPEQWIRQEQQNDIYRGLAALLFTFLKAFGCVLTLFYVRKQLLAYGISKKSIIGGLLLGLVNLLATFNAVPQMIGTLFTTSQPFYAQLFSMISMSSIGVTIVSLGIVFLIVNAQALRFYRASTTSHKITILLAVAAQLLVIGTLSVIEYSAPSYRAYTPDYEILNSFSTLFATIVNPLNSFLFITILFMLIAKTAQLMTNNWTIATYKGLLFFFIFFLGQGFQSATYLSVGIVAALCYALLMSCIFYLLFRHDQSGIIIMTGTGACLNLLANGAGNPYPHALVYAIIASACYVASSYWWFLHIRKQTK